MTQDPSTFLYRLACSLATAEGAFASGSLPNSDGNPGDLRLAPWVAHPTIKGGFWRPASIEEGIAGLVHQIALDVARGWSLRQLVFSYAPPTDGNDSANYLSETGRRMGIDAADFDRPLWNFLAPLVKIP
jgi:hypothetical protein